MPAHCAQDFTSAVMDVDYSPTGREFVAGSYDRSVRIFAHNGGHSREVYHTKRMQRVFAVRFSGDASYVFSGSDDMNLRVWKAGPSNPAKIWSPCCMSMLACCNSQRFLRLCRHFLIRRPLSMLSAGDAERGQSEELTAMQVLPASVISWGLVTVPLSVRLLLV